MDICAGLSVENQNAFRPPRDRRRSSLRLTARLSSILVRVRSVVDVATFAHGRFLVGESTIATYSLPMYSLRSTFTMPFQFSAPKRSYKREWLPESRLMVNV